MRKAILVLATSVAFLLFVVPNSYAGIKKKVQLPTAQSVANGSGIPVKSGSSLSIPGALQGEFIPGDNPSRTTPIKVLPTIDFSIPRTINAAKRILKNNAGSIAIGGVISGLVLGLDWVMGDGSQPIKKPVPALPVDPSTGSIYWCWENAQGTCLKRVSSVTQAQQSLADDLNSRSDPGYKTWAPDTATRLSDTNYRITVKSGTYGTIVTAFAVRYGTCPTGWLPSGGQCSSSSEPSYVPITDSDLSLVDAYATAQSSDWLRDLLRESCSGSLAPDRCYEDLKDNVSLTGPLTVSGPTSISTTTGPNGTTTKETKTNYQITYGSDYFIYAPTTTTTTVNPDGTTEVETEEETTEEEAQEEEIDTTIPNLYKPVLDKYDSISDDVGDAQGPGSGITWGPWYSFGGACTEIQTQLPIIGYWSTNYCPYIYDFVRPVLMFLFVVFTWHYCKEMFQEALEKGRPV